MRGRFVLRWLGVAAIVAAPSLIVISSASATTETVTNENVTATLTYDGTLPVSPHPHLRITLDGHVVYDQAVTSRWCATECSPNVVARARQVVHVVHFQATGLPSILLDLYSGGAHCCAIEQVYSLRANSQSVVKIEHNFGDPGVRLVKLGAKRSVDLVSADDSFAYEFTDFAASGLPIEVLSFSDDAFHNVTRSFPALITKDAAQWMSAFRAQASTHYRDSVGVAAAWAADEDMLGRSLAVARFLTAEAKAGHLNSALSPIAPSGQKYVDALQIFLRKRGYLR